MNKIFAIDDDHMIRETLSIILNTHGFEVIFFADGFSLVEAVLARTPLCILIDVFLPNDDGLQILQRLRSANCGSPIIMMSGSADISTAITAIRLGAIDFVEKPFSGRLLLERIEAAVNVMKPVPEIVPSSFNKVGLRTLTGREEEILRLVLAGYVNKEIASKLGISFRTVEDHRSIIMKKLGARNAAHLAALVANKMQIRPT